jgi:hypothetical protein
VSLSTIKNGVKKANPGKYFVLTLFRGAPWSVGGGEDENFWENFRLFLVKF